MDTPDYCRQIETYLVQKNEGHLIRITGPSFDLVSGWAEQGVPLKIVFRGIDRRVERHRAKGPRRRPVRIDFCEADVLDAFDEWRRATGLAAARDREPADGDSPPTRRGPSLPAHVQRVLLRLTAARAAGALGEGFDPLLDRVAQALEAAKGARGEKRQALIAQLASLDRELTEGARAALDAGSLATLAREADEELARFRDGMAPAAFARARDAAIDRLVRERAHLPTIAFS